MQQWKQFVGNHFAWQALPVTACLSEQDRAGAFFPRLSRSAGNRRRFVQLAFNLPVVGTSSRQPGIEAAAKGRIAPSENAGNADLVAAAAGFGGLEERFGGFKSQSVVGRHQWIQD